MVKHAVEGRSSPSMRSSPNFGRWAIQDLVGELPFGAGRRREPTCAKPGLAAKLKPWAPMPIECASN